MARGDWPEDGSSADETISPAWRRAGYAAAAAAFLLGAGAIHVSTYEVGYGTRLYGERTLVAGERAALRVAAYVPSLGDFASDAVARLTLVHEGGRSEQLGEGPVGMARSLEVNPTLSADLPEGRYEIRVDIETSAGEPETAYFPVEVIRDAPRPGWLAVRHVCEERSRRDEEGHWKRAAACADGAATPAFYPQSGSLVANLMNRVLIRFAPDVELASVQALSPRVPGGGDPKPIGKPWALLPDAMGFAGFDLLPSYPRGKLRVSIRETVTEVWVRDLPSQIIVTAQRSILTPGEPLQAKVALLRAGVPVFLDLWIGGRWIGTDSAYLRSGGEIRYEVGLPPGTEGLVMLRAYTSIDGPAGAQDHLVFYVTAHAQTANGLRELARTIGALPVAAPLAAYDTPPGLDPMAAAILGAEPEQFARLDQDGIDRVARAMLSRIEPKQTPTLLLGDSTEQKSERLRDWKRGLRRPLLGGVLALALAVAMGTLWLVVTGQRAVRRRFADLQADHSVEGEDGDDIARTGMVVQSIVMLLVAGASIMGILILLESLSWGG